MKLQEKSQDSEIKEMNVEYEKQQKKDNIAPIWFYRDEQNRKRVSHLGLMKEILNENKMFYDNTSKEGFWYDRYLGHWKVGFSSFLAKVITDKLISVGYWKPNDFNSTKLLITNEVFLKDKINYFDNSDPRLIHFKNGTYNILTGKLQPHSFKDYILSGHKYSLNMRDEATMTDQWFKESFGEASLFMKEFIGYIFFRSYEPFQKFVILIGKGNDGKSTFLNYLREIAGSDNTSNVSISDLADSDKSKFLIAEMFQKDVNYYADVSDDFLKESSVLKTLTGNDWTVAQFKHQKPFMFRNHAKLIFSANSLPPFRDFTKGFERRPVIVQFHAISDFESRFSKRKIYNEIPAFSYECINSFNQALNRGKLSETAEMKHSVEEWLKQNDHVAEFVEECCKLDTTAFEKNIYVKDAYKEFCQQNGYQQLSVNKFNERLKKFGVEANCQKKIKGNVIKGYSGLSLVS
ncbi:DNA primase family protein [Liquorilactobacillus nagelii]|uniref:DNA primase family protein n=1 Tax=Liquorilactobacillus nagelii TaxID=82688 RepID=UPI0039EC299E